MRIQIPVKEPKIPDDYHHCLKVVGNWERDNMTDMEGSPHRPKYIAGMVERIKAYEEDFGATRETYIIEGTIHRSPDEDNMWWILGTGALESEWARTQTALGVDTFMSDLYDTKEQAMEDIHSQAANVIEVIRVAGRKKNVTHGGVSIAVELGHQQGYRGDLQAHVRISDGRLVRKEKWASVNIWEKHALDWSDGDPSSLSTHVYPLIWEIIKDLRA